jgi:hypothetical protein
MNLFTSLRDNPKGSFQCDPRRNFTQSESVVEHGNDAVKDRIQRRGIVFPSLWTYRHHKVSSSNRTLITPAACITSTKQAHLDRLTVLDARETVTAEETEAMESSPLLTSSAHKQGIDPMTSTPNRVSLKETSAFSRAKNRFRRATVFGIWGNGVDEGQEQPAGRVSKVTEKNRRHDVSTESHDSQSSVFFTARLYPQGSSLDQSKSKAETSHNSNRYLPEIRANGEIANVTRLQPVARGDNNRLQADENLRIYPTIDMRKKAKVDVLRRLHERQMAGDFSRFRNRNILFDGRFSDAEKARCVFSDRERIPDRLASIQQNKDPSFLETGSQVEWPSPGSQPPSFAGGLERSTRPQLWVDNSQELPPMSRSDKISTGEDIQWKNANKNFFPRWALGMPQEEVLRRIIGNAE